jgi:hypothetical protein
LQASKQLVFAYGTEAWQTLAGALDSMPNTLAFAWKHAEASVPVAAGEQQLSADQFCNQQYLQVLLFGCSPPLLRLAAPANSSSNQL